MPVCSAVVLDQSHTRGANAARGHPVAGCLSTEGIIHMNTLVCSTPGPVKEAINRSRVIDVVRKQLESACERWC